jgi:hypothetical protein
MMRSNLSRWYSTFHPDAEAFAEWLERTQRRYYIAQKVARMWVEGANCVLLDGLDG